MAPFVAFESEAESLAVFVVLVDFLDSFLFDEVPDRPAVHDLHEVGFEVVEGEAEVEVVFGVAAHIIEEFVGFGLDDVLEDAVDFVSLVVFDVVGLVLFGEAQADFFRFHSLIILLLY